MRILFVHPNYHSGGAEIAGTWSPSWVAYLTGHLRRAGFDDIHFIDAMTEDVSDTDLARRMADLQPDAVGVAAITPSIYKAEGVLKIASEVVPQAVRVLGCLYAFLRAGFKRTFYDLGKAGNWGPQTKRTVDFHCDETRTIAEAQLEDWEASADRVAKAAERRDAVRAQMKERAEVRACGDAPSHTHA